ncbi:MAG: hypothetical protein K8T10_04175 [Candidatus Eremiobacteraeota bacterium]|nr:hypothetical protein [Candidatus Eremiobacteraeota bacterium]
MNIIIKYIFPILLILGTIYLLFVEFRTYSRLKRMGQPIDKLKGRIIRRIIGAIFVCLIAIMLLWGLNKLEPMTMANWRIHARYWGVVIGLILITAGFAVWDMMAGLKHLENLIDKSTFDQFEEIKSKINTTDSKPGNPTN